MFKNLSLDSKQIYQVELVIITLCTIACIALNVVKIMTLFTPTNNQSASNTREQQFQNAINIIAPELSRN